MKHMSGGAHAINFEHQKMEDDSISSEMLGCLVGILISLPKPPSVLDPVVPRLSRLFVPVQLDDPRPAVCVDRRSY